MSADPRLAYDLAKQREGQRVATNERAVYEQILGGVVALYRGQLNGYARCMAEVYRRCGDAAGFPEYETWVAAHSVELAEPSPAGATA